MSENSLPRRAHLRGGEENAPGHYITNFERSAARSAAERPISPLREGRTERLGEFDFMYGSLSLNGVWSLTGNDDFPAFLTAETLPGRHAYRAEVPAPIHQVLQDAGVLDDPNFGMNSLRARWVEEMYWAYRRTFATPDDVTSDAAAWLVFDKLEMNAVVYLNGAEVGRHANAHRPAHFDVKKFLHPPGEENTLCVLIDAGLFAVSELPGAEYRDTPQARLTKIHWQRRGQWQRGWDWQQRLLNVGILGDVSLEYFEETYTDQAVVYARTNEDLSEAAFVASVTIWNAATVPVKRTLALVISEPGGKAQLYFASHSECRDHTLQTKRTVYADREITVPPGESHHSIEVTLPDPRLWWPIGHGEPFLYEAQISVIVPRDGESDEGQDSDSFQHTVGVRKVEVDQSAHPVEGKHFILKINNKPIFCKGGNWVPADMLHSTVTPERYRELVDLAIGANFNMLRVWGGGIYADESLLNYCDEKGILVWHDLLFACSKYPGDYPEWVAEVRREVTWAMREMAHHPSLVVWCGNNEIEEGDWHWGYDDAYRTHPHYALFHHDLPQIAGKEAPHCFYWISSPYSPDYKSPRDPTVGDQHPWKVSLQMAGGADWWEYRKMVDRFPNEGGVLGASSPATLRQFLPENERYLLSPSWEHHDNPFAINDTTPGRLGHVYQTVQLWTGLDPLELDWERYAFLSALLQAEGIAEYIHNFRRRMFSSASAIFWMYNDSWPTTHGWTIVDYYRRKKLAYHPVRRAFAPVTCVAADDGDGVAYFVVNDSNKDWIGKVSYGTFAVDGGLVEVDTLDFAVAANVAERVGDGWAATYFEGERAKTFGAFICLYEGERLVAQHRTFFFRFGELNLVTDPKIETTLEDNLLTLKSDVFCWGVCLDVDGEIPLTDNCFDLLPGVPYSLPWDSAVLGEPHIVRVGNRELT